jgi:hypothetical protein
MDDIILNNYLYYLMYHFTTFKYPHFGGRRSKCFTFLIKY